MNLTNITSRAPKLCQCWYSVCTSLCMDGSYKRKTTIRFFFPYAKDIRVLHSRRYHKEKIRNLWCCSVFPRLAIAVTLFSVMYLLGNKIWLVILLLLFCQLKGISCIARFKAILVFSLLNCLDMRIAILHYFSFINHTKCINGTSGMLFLSFPCR